MKALLADRFRLGLACAGLVIVLDQVSKWLVMDVILKQPRVIEVLPFFNLVWVWNPGVSFGMFPDLGSEILIGLSLVIAALLVVWMRRAESMMTAIGLAGCIGGALGNVIDRFRFEAVFDFLDVYIGTAHWPAFNIADSAISVGVAMMIVDGLFFEGRRQRRQEGE